MIEKGRHAAVLHSLPSQGTSAPGESARQPVTETRPDPDVRFAGQRHATRYAITMIGTLGGDESGAAGLNPAGQIVGTATTDNGNARPFRWQRGTLAALGLPPGCANGVACAINQAGQVVGFARDRDRGERAIYWEGQAPTLLPGLTLHGESYASAINTQGDIVGSAVTAQGDLHAVCWQAAGLRDLGTLGGALSRAYGVNVAGQIAGMAQDGRGVGRAVLWDTGEIHDLGLPVDCTGRALGIDASGQAVGGFLCATRGRRAFLWSNGVLNELPPPLGCVGGEAAASNARGQIVGGGWDERGEQRAILWSDGTATDLNDLLPPDSGWVLEWARGITGEGAIVGRGRYGGVPRAFLLAPATEHHRGVRDHAANRGEGKGFPALATNSRAWR